MIEVGGVAPVRGAGPRDDERANQHERSTTTPAASSSNTLVYSPPLLTDDLRRKAICHRVNVVAARETILLLGRVQSGPAPCVRRRTPKARDPGTMNAQTACKI